MLNLCDLWPDVPLLGYMEFYYQANAADVGFDPEFFGINEREAEAIEHRYPKVLRKVGGYYLDLMLPLSSGGREVTEGNRGRFPSVRERPGPSLQASGATNPAVPPTPSPPSRSARFRAR